MMEPALGSLIELFTKMHLRKPSIPYVSNVTGRWITDSEATDPHYWARHMRLPVRFAEGLGELIKSGETILLEVGPGQTLSAFASQHPDRDAGRVVLSTLGGSRDRELSALLTTLGRLWLAGAPVDWPGFYRYENRIRVTLPTYPFERQRFWIEPTSSVVSQLGTAIDVGLTAITTLQSTEAISLSAAQETDENHGDLLENGLSRKDRIRSALTSIFGELSGADLTSISPSASFMEMGLDSLVLAQASQTIAKRFGITIAFRQLLRETSTIEKLIDFIDQKLPLNFSLSFAPSAPAVYARRTGPLA
jgi:acyl transferase domain-containing protein